MIPEMSMTVRTLALGGALATALGLGAPTAAHAQQAPPAPLPLTEVSFPDFDERTLDNGARLIVVPNDEVPAFSINLIFPGGSALDPEGREGLAGMVAQVLDQGTGTRTHEQIAEELDFLGAVLGSGASDDNVSVTLLSLTEFMEPALEIMADVVMNATFPQDRIELLRSQTLSALQVQLSQAGAVAGRAFNRVVYGDHPYGKLETPASVQALTRDDLVAYHDQWFSPSGALFVVAGDVDADRMAAALERAFRGWTGPAVTPPEYAEVQDRAAPEVILVHKPGSVQAEIRVGHLLAPGDDPDWTALQVANQVLGGVPTGRLFQNLREEQGLTYDARSSASRRRGQGALSVALGVRSEVTGQALTSLFEEIRRLRDNLIPEDELEDTKAFLTGSFPLQIETPQQVASRVAQNRLLGLPEDAIETFRSRVQALDAERVRRVVRDHIDPQRAAIVVVGDANQVRDQLEGFGPVRLLDVSLNDLDPASLVAQAPSRTFDATGLEPLTLEYQVSFQGNPVGSTERVVEVNADGTLRFASNASLGPQTVEQSVTVTAADLGFVSSSTSMSMQGQTFGGEVSLRDGRIQGTMRSPMGEMPVDIEATEGLMVSDMVELAVWVSDLDEGETIQIPVANLQTGATENLRLQVAAVEEVTVPAGTFQAYRVEVEGSQAQTLWARVEAPHIVLKLSPAAQPVVLELTSPLGN